MQACTILTLPLAVCLDKTLAGFRSTGTVSSCFCSDSLSQEPGADGAFGIWGHVFDVCASSCVNRSNCPRCECTFWDKDGGEQVFLQRSLASRIENPTTTTPHGKLKTQKRSPRHAQHRS